MPDGGPDMSEGGPENMPPLDVEHSISVVDWLICSSVSMMVLLNLCITVCVDSWFATTPAGIDIIIANEKLKATITNNALIFLLEMFLIALVKAPKLITVPSVPCLIE
jgi:fumarate reductase subunit C